MLLQRPLSLQSLFYQVLFRYEHARGAEDAVRAGRLHHPVLLEHHRRPQREAGRLRRGQVRLPVRQLLAQERRIHRVGDEEAEASHGQARSGGGWRSGVLTLLLISLVVFAAVLALPGDAATAILGKEATPDRVAALREQLTSNDSVISQYLQWIGGVLTGSFGTSAATQQPVSELLSDRVANTRVPRVRRRRRGDPAVDRARRLDGDAAATARSTTSPRPRRWCSRRCRSS